jgi:spore germination cell wall hydrolase CwlJ-like protein
VTVLKFLISEGLEAAGKWRGREAVCLPMLLLSASCVPLNAATAPPPAKQSARIEAAGIPGVAPLAQPEPEEMVLAAVAPGDAPAVNAAIPLAAVANPRASSTVFRAAGSLDQMRALQCLAEAVYYEARSESEDGQRAVAQVVLNRVRHPSYPGSVCGVVYQGPMRPGGGCQFTFTCDGSLGRPARGFDWDRARRVAAEALSGKVHAPVGHATHYHTHQVVPAWAYRLAKVAVIGAHNFYRIPDRWGTPGAFSQRYAGREPAPAAVIAERLPVSPEAVPLVFAPQLPAVRLPVEPLAYLQKPAAPLPAAAPPAAAAADDPLPQSTIREEFRNSGRWRTDIPPAEPASVR